MARYANKKKKEEEQKKSTVSARAMRNDKAKEANAVKTTTSSAKQTTVKKSANRSSRTMGNNKGLFENSRLFSNKADKKENNKTTVKRKGTTSKNRGSAISNNKKGNENKIATSAVARRAGLTQNDYKKLEKKTENRKKVIGGTLQQIVGSHAKSVGLLAGYDKKTSGRSMGKYGNPEDNVVNSEKRAKKISDWGTKQIEKGNKKYKKATKDMSKTGKFGADVANAAIGLATDAVAGPLAPVSMFSRSFGSAANTAQREGATDEQAAMYGLASGTLEMATERLGNVAKPLQKLYGKGVADDLAERVAKKMANKATKQSGKDLAYHGGKTAAAFVSEALEEMVAEGLDPVIANTIYANETGTQHSTSLKEIARAGLVGGVLGGVLGAGGQVVEYGQGSQVRDIYGEDGVKQLAKVAKESDDDADAFTAEALDKMINEGGGIAAGQALQLKRAVEKQNAKDRTIIEDINAATDKVMKDKGLVNFIRKIDEEGNLDLTDSAREVYEGTKQRATEVADMIAPKDGQNQLKDMTVDEITSEVASIVTGAVTDIDTVNTFTTGNTLARQIYEQTTGETLPATNRETRAYLYEKIARNRQTSLEAETALQMDRMKGDVIQKVASTYAKNGQALFSNVMEGVDVRNMRQLNDSIVAFEDYYEAGRSGLTLQEMADLKNPAYDMLPPEIKTSAWNAGVQDKNAALGAVEERVLQLGQSLGESQPQAKSVAPRGKVIHEFQDAENAMRFTASQNAFYQKMAETFNINIHITDNPDYNGNYQNGEVWMSVDADRDLSYVFAHEITHHLQQYAPQEYNDYKELVRSAWGVEELNAAIRAKIAHYAQHNVNLSREDAFDEIVADATYEMVQDPAFVNELCNEDRTLAKQILDALRNMIKKIRAMLAGEKKFTPAQNEGLLSQLDILKEAERLWEIGLKKAEENRDAVGMVDTSEDTQYQFAGYAEDGRGIYVSDYKKGVSKDEKTKDVLDLIVNLWSKKPIELVVKEPGKEDRVIEAKFDPYYEEGVNSDAGKIAGGNTAGTRVERRVNLNIGKDYYQILSEAEYTGTNAEDMQHDTSDTHKEGQIWHYFLNQIYYKENADGELEPYTVFVNVRENKDGSFVYGFETYQDGNVEKAAKRKRITLTSALAETDDSANSSNSSTNIISETSENSNKKFSLKDSEGRELSANQAEYFADSKIRDENGNLLVMYHGTDSYEEFNVFKSGKSGYLGKGMYFSDSEAYAKRYATKNGYDGRIYKTYLNVKNPLVVTSENPAVEILGEKLAARREKSNSFSTTWIKPSDIKKLVDKGYDGIIWKYGATIEVSVWNSNQIKNIDNENPTENPDIRYSLKDSDGKDMSVEEANDKAVEHFGETDSWKETGYLLTDGRRLDFSGRHWGGSGGGREVDHRDIWDAFEADDMDGPEAMVAFMGMGNVRIMFESGGIDLAKSPTPEQQEMLEDYIEAFGGEIVLDIDNGEGRTVNSTEYPAGTSASKVLNDIKRYFRTGKTPVVSEMAKFRYSLKDADDVNEYVNAHPEEFAEVMQYFYSEQQAHHTRQKTMQELQSQLEKMKVDKKLTHGRVLDPKSIEEDANSLVRMMLSYKEENTKLTDHKLVKMIQANAKDIFAYLKDGDQENAIMTAYHAAEELVHNLNMANDEMYHTYKELRDYLRNTRVYIPNEYLGDFPDLAEFRTRQMGRIRLVNEESGGKSVDTMYEELLEMFPGMFDETLDNPADQMYEIRDVREQLDPYEIVLSHEETEQLIKEAAHDILELAVNGKPWKSWADRNKEVYDEKIRALKQKHQEAVRDVRLKEKERAEKKIEAVRAKADERLQQAKEKGEQKLQEEKQKNKERQQNQRDQRKKRETIAKMEKQIAWLSERLLKPTDDKHLPEGYQKAIAQLLYSIDTQSERAKKLEEKYGLSKKRLKFLELKDQYEKIAAQADADIMIDEDIKDDLSNLAELLEDQPISEASPAQLEQIYKVLRNITHGIRMVNQAFVEGQKATISEMAEETIETAQKKKPHDDRTGMIGGLDSILNESMVAPRDFFERIGGGVEQAYIGIRKGFDKHVDNITTARTFFEGMFKKYYNKKEPGSALEKWRDNSTNETFPLEQGGEITLNVAQRMSLYCLMKREQAQSHILGSGIVATEVDINSKVGRVLGAKIKNKASTAKITWFDIDKILETLTPEQIEMANELQNFLNNECAAWGNEVSMKMYGYEKFTEENYFPIKAADVYLDSQFEGRTSIEKIRNFGFTKGTVVNANNPIVIDDIFTVVSDHINKMSMYNGFAAPIADFTRVYNYKSRDEDGTIVASTKAALQDAYGKKVGSYITKFIADLQSNTQTRTEGVTRLVNKTLANYKKATIAGNLRVALQQPTAIIRAYMLISPKYFTSLNAKKNTERMKEHCQVARWKAWGHNQVDMARDIDDIMMNNEWTKLDLFTMQIYGALDTVTWSYIWGAVEKEIQAKHPNVKVDSDEYFELCNDRASEIFDKTQVVDSVLHRSEVMRNQDTMSKMVTSFMAEPTRTYNMIRGQYAKALDQWRDGDKGKATATAWKASSIFLVNAMVCAMAAAVADVLRGKDLDGDDEPEEWLENVWNNFKGNANPLMMIPVMSEALNYWQGWGSQNMALEGIESLMTSTKGLWEKMKGDSDKTWGELFRKEAESLGLVFGVPVKNVLREFETFAKLLGWEASAATEMTEEEKPSVFERIDDKDLFSIENGSFMDNVLNHFGWNLTEAEKVERERQQQIKEYEGKLDGLTGADRQEKMWSIVMKGYTTDLKTGNVASIEERRKILEAMGGDIEYFDERVQEKVIAAYKKTIGTEDGTSAILKEYLMTEYGYTEGKISTEIICKSDVAKDFQLAMCANNEQEAVDALVVLLNEGITEADIYTLYYNRYKAIDVGDYVTGEMDSPVDGRVTSTFGWRDAPTAGASSYHEGIDIAATAGSVVGAADGGKVSSCGYNKTEGYFVRISHGNGRYTEYKHLEGFCVYKGQPVAAGQEIGRVGSTGVSTGPHLHFSVEESGVYVDPAPYLK